MRVAESPQPAGAVTLRAMWYACVGISGVLRSNMVQHGRLGVRRAEGTVTCGPHAALTCDVQLQLEPREQKALIGERVSF